jgi:ribosomal protein S19E (S16A)
MKLNDRLRTILTSIAQSPRRPTHFTHGYNSQINPDVLNNWLTKLTEAGYCFEAEGAYHITVKGRQALDQNNTAGVRQYVIGKGIYKGETDQYYRPGSDHSHIKSHGVQC